jgi:hypothetical protein
LGGDGKRSMRESIDDLFPCATEKLLSDEQVAKMDTNLPESTDPDRFFST